MPQLLSLPPRARVLQLPKSSYPKACMPLQLLSPSATTTEAQDPRARAPQEKPPEGEVRAPQRRVAPAQRN